jgi:hypothetical protein
MIFCKDLLFIHIPKTAGISIGHYFLEILPRPLYYSLPQSEPQPPFEDVTFFPGIRHETLGEARKIIKEYGFELRKFPVILAVIRNPYSLEVSRFAYLQHNYPWDRGKNQDLALTGSFETFARESHHHRGPNKPIESYLLVDGKLPANLRTIKCEDLPQALSEVLEEIGVKTSTALPWKNKSKHDDYRTYYTPAAEEAVFKKYQWLFDQGYYERMDPSEYAKPSVTEESASASVQEASQES